MSTAQKSWYMHGQLYVLERHEIVRLGTIECIKVRTTCDDRMRLASRALL